MTLVHQAGYEPLGQVMGSSVYHVGWQWMPYSSWNSGELTMLTQAFYEARHLALGRLYQEAALLGATGVVGVRLEKREYEWGAGLLEFAAIGTAIRETDVPPPAWTEPRNRFSATCPAKSSGCCGRPDSVPSASPSATAPTIRFPPGTRRLATTGGWLGGSWNNQELARLHAVALQCPLARDEPHGARGAAVQAVGIVGADVEIDSEPREVESQQQPSHRHDLPLHRHRHGHRALYGTLADFQGDEYGYTQVDSRR